MTKTIEELWLSYERVGVPKGAGRVQRRQSRRAFYAGIQGYLGLLASLDPGAEPTDHDMERMEAWAEELAQFRRDIENRRA